MEHDDDLIGRLEALGGKLDERREAAAARTVDESRRAGGRGPRAIAVAAAAVVVLAIAVAALVAVGRDRDQTIRTDATTTSTTAPELDQAVVAALAAELRARDDQAVVDCAAAEATSTTSPSAPPVDEREYSAVGIGPGCLKGWIRTTGKDGDDLVPVHTTPESAEVIGYWLAGVGWITPEDAREPGFDPVLLRAAAELAERTATSGG